VGAHPLNKIPNPTKIANLLKIFMQTTSIEYS